MDIRFISHNESKITEAVSILGKAGVNVIPIDKKIEELQTENMKHLVEDKALKAFKLIGRPLFVEHTGLYIEKINSLPGGLTQVFWDNLEADKFSELFGNSKAKAVTVIGYIDGKRFHSFTGEIMGSIVTPPRGNRVFQWDCIFVPDGESETFAELGERKNEISMRRKALEKFMVYLNAVEKNNDE